MTDMLVRLYEIPDLSGYTEKMEKIGVRVRRPNVWEKPLLLGWVKAHFSLSWALECETAFAVRPPSCFIAVKDDALIGFACYDCTRLNFFGPTGVVAACHGKRGGDDAAAFLSSRHEGRRVCLCYHRRRGSCRVLRQGRGRHDHRRVFPRNL